MDQNASERVIGVVEAEHSLSAAEMLAGGACEWGQCDSFILPLFIPYGGMEVSFFLCCTGFVLYCLFPLLYILCPPFISHLFRSSPSLVLAPFIKNQKSLFMQNILSESE